MAVLWDIVQLEDKHLTLMEEKHLKLAEVAQEVVLQLLLIMQLPQLVLKLQDLSYHLVAKTL